MSRRVVYFINSLSGGGAENGLLTLIDSGMFQGTELYVLAMNMGDGKISAALSERLPADRIKVLSSGSKMGLGLMLKALLYYPWFVVQQRATVVILSLEQTNIIGRFWAHVMPWVKIYSFEHNVKYAKNVYGPILKALSLPVRGILSDSQRTEQSILSKWFLRPSTAAQVVPLFRASASAQVSSRHGIHTPLRLVAAGRLTTQKNQQVILHAMALLRGMHISATLTLFGEGPDKDKLQQVAESLGLTESITFAGYHANWNHMLGEHDVYLQPSLYEGLCITLLEAMAQGIPCIAASVGEIPQYGRHEGNILLLDDASPQSLAFAISRLKADAGLRATIGAQGLQDIQYAYGEAAVAVAVQGARNMMGLASQSGTRS